MGLAGFRPSVALVRAMLMRDDGVYLLELLMLEEFLAAQVTRFLFVLAPLRIADGTGSPVSPLAIV
jgi:kynurenine formamidase